MCLRVTSARCVWTWCWITYINGYKAAGGDTAEFSQIDEDWLEAAEFGEGCQLLPSYIDIPVLTHAEVSKSCIDISTKD